MENFNFIRLNIFEQKLWIPRELVSTLYVTFRLLFSFFFLCAIEWIFRKSIYFIHTYIYTQKYFTAAEWKFILKNTLSVINHEIILWVFYLYHYIFLLKFYLNPTPYYYLLPPISPGNFHIKLGNELQNANFS